MIETQGQRPLLAVSNGILLALLTALLVTALTFDRSEWPSLVGDEATYLMAAESLAFDLDLRYEREDFERFVDHWQLDPDGLILQSGDAGNTLTFGKPFFYPLWAAPFVRISPTRGPFVASVLFLGIAAFLAARTMRQTVGPLAPLWVATSVFASVAFAYAYWAHADLFLLSVTASALSLAFWTTEESSGKPAGLRRSWWRWTLVGVLLAMVVFSRPLYLPLLLPILFALPRRARGRAGIAVLLGALGLIAAAVAIHRLNGDAWTSYGAQRRGFYSSTGFPVVDFPAEEWAESLEDLGDAAWAEARTMTQLPRTDASLWFWNSVYFLGGRFIGVLPYFLPLVLGLLGRPKGTARWMLLLAVVASVAGFFLYRPFNIYGGGGALANRYFMPLFPAFWFLATRPCRLRRLLAVWLVATPFLWPLWRECREFPQRANHTFRYVSSLAQDLLPFETTQSHLKPSGRSDVLHQGLWVKFLSPSLRSQRDGSALLLDRGQSGALLIGAYEPLQVVNLLVREDSSETLVVRRGAEILEESESTRGRRLRLQLAGPRARHPMWWTWATVYLYEIHLESESTGEGRVSFLLRKGRAGEEDPS